MAYQNGLALPDDGHDIIHIAIDVHGSWVLPSIAVSTSVKTDYLAHA
jgi:hypothetical protein